MKTADLIADLAQDAGPVAPASPVRRLAAMTVVGALLALAILLPWLGLRPLGVAVRLGSFWMKASYTSALALAGWILASRLSRPTASLRAPLFAVTFVVLTMASMAAMELLSTARADLPLVWLGYTWNRCPIRIATLAIPIFVLVVLTLRRLAPTRLRAAGAAGGLLAGAASATVYGLYCDETTAAFTMTWYTLGIAACAGVGALLGPRLLRW